MKSANPYSLVILDEIGSGTDPVEGEGLAIAILETLHERGATILATSHYGKVKTFARDHKGFINGKMDFDIATLKPTYQLIMGEAGESNAFVIALRLGMESRIINRAHSETYGEAHNYNADSELFASKEIVTTIKSKKPKAMEKSSQKQGEDRLYQRGDQVTIPSMHSKGIVYEAENYKKEVVVMIEDKKTTLHRRLLNLKIPAEQLYPEGYDFDILFKSKDYRKQDKLMSRKYVKDRVFEVDIKDL